MKLLPVHLILLSSFVISKSEVEDTISDICEDDEPPNDLGICLHQGNVVDMGPENFLCLLYPTNTLNCTWSFHLLQNDTQVSVMLSVCDGQRTVHSFTDSSQERVGSLTLRMIEYEKLSVKLLFNVTLHNNWTVYSYKYSKDSMEVLSPPEIVSASVEDGDLLVNWTHPQTQVSPNKCLQYQLDLGDQEKPKDLPGQLSYTEPNADPSYTYRVRIRTKFTSTCRENSQWSEWSHIATVEQPVDQHKTYVIVSISLGIPMILLAVVLLVRNQRVSKILFPPIPRPPQKYINFLQKNDTFNVIRPALSAEPEEEITVVEYTKPNPEKAS